MKYSKDRVIDLSNDDGSGGDDNESDQHSESGFGTEEAGKAS